MPTPSKIAEGEYGFLVYPALPYIDRSTVGMVSKIFKTPDEMSEKHKSRHVPFDKLRTRMLPVATVLKRIDPDQKKYIYPDFSGTPGPLTDDLGALGINDTNKFTSYLMAFSDGVTAEESFGVFNRMLDAAMCRDKSLDGKAFVKKIYAAYEPFLNNVDVVVNTMHDAQIVHYDLHPGNLMLDWDDAKFGHWLKHMLSVYKRIRSTSKFRRWFDIVHEVTSDNSMLTYELSDEELAEIYGLLDELLTVDTSLVYPRIIDWDSAVIEPDSEFAGDEHFELITMLMPTYGPAGCLRAMHMDT